MGGGVEELGKGVGREVGSVQGSLGKGGGQVEMGEGYMKSMGVEKKEEMWGQELVEVGKLMDEMKKGSEGKEGLKKVSGSQGGLRGEEGGVKDIEGGEE